MTDFPLNFSNPRTEIRNFSAFSSSPFQQALNSQITPFEINNSPLQPDSLLNSKEKIGENTDEILLKTAKKSTNFAGNNIINAKKIKEIISNLDAKTPFHLIFDCDESPSFESLFKEFVVQIQETEKNPISILHELCHNLKVDINVQIEPKLQPLDKNNRNVRFDIFSIFPLKFLYY